MDDFWVIAAIVFGGPLLFGGIVRLCITINDVQHAVKLENDPLMVMFLQRMEQGAIRTFYINDSIRDLRERTSSSASQSFLIS